MVLLSAMQSGVTDNLINALRLSLGDFWHRFQDQA